MKVSLSNKKINEKKDYVSYICIFFLLYLSSSYQISSISGTMRLIYFLILSLFVLLWYGSRKLSLKRNVIFILLIALINIILTAAINNETFFDATIMVAILLTAFAFSITIPFKKFVKVYCDIIFFICIFSSVAYFVALFWPNIITSFPETYNINGVPANNLFFTIIRPNDYLLRNFGLFWEPGAFQTYISLGLIFNLYILKKNTIKFIIVSIITLLTTFSSTGYIVGGLILFAYIFWQTFAKKENMINKNKDGIVVVFLVLITIIAYFNLPSNAQYQVFGKIASYSKDRTVNTAISIRYDALRYPLMAFFSSPIYGVGYEKLYELAKTMGYNMNTCTPVNWLAIYGIFIGFIFNIGFYKITNSFIVPKHIKILLFIAFLLAISSEDYARNSSILVFVFYGWQTKKIYIVLNLS